MGKGAKTCAITEVFFYGTHFSIGNVNDFFNVSIINLELNEMPPFLKKKTLVSLVDGWMDVGRTNGQTDG